MRNSRVVSIVFAVAAVLVWSTASADPKKGTGGVIKRLDRNLEATESVGDGVRAVDAKVGRTGKRIRRQLNGMTTVLSGNQSGITTLIDQSKLQGALIDALPKRLGEELAPRKNPAWPLWVGVRVNSSVKFGNGSRPSLVQFSGTVISFLNPGELDANVGCTFFDDNGLLQIDRGGVQTVIPGAKGRCTAHSGSGVDDDFSGWVLISSDRPILPDARNSGTSNDARESRIELYPLDCSAPSGVGFACRFVRQ